MGELIDKYLEYVALKEKLESSLMSELEAIANRALFRATNVHSAVRKYFSFLKPYSYKKVVIRWYLNQRWNEYYCVVVSKDITEGWEKHVSEERARGYHMWDESFFRAIVDVGDEIAKVVRRHIRDKFSKLVELTRKLKTAEPTVVLMGEFKVFMQGRSRYVTFRKLEVCSRDPDELTFKGPDTEYMWEHETFGLGRGLLPIEDIYDDVKRALLELERRVADIKKHNEEIFRQMRQVVAPYALANNL